MHCCCQRIVHHLVRCIDVVRWARVQRDAQDIADRLMHMFTDCIRLWILHSGRYVLKQFPDVLVTHGIHVLYIFLRLAYNINAKFEHVKGHQDDNLEYQQLSLKAQLNIDADALAGLF